MAATLRYGRERAHLGRSLLNFMRIARDAHAPDLTLGKVGDLLFTAIEVFLGHAFECPMVLSELSRNLEMPRDAVQRLSIARTLSNLFIRSSAAPSSIESLCANFMARSQFSFASSAALWIFATMVCPTSSTGVS